DAAMGSAREPCHVRLAAFPQPLVTKPPAVANNRTVSIYHRRSWRREVVAKGRIMGADWAPLHGVAAKQQHEARLYAHYGAQWLARAARAYVPERPDDGHTNLGWDDGFGGFTTHPVPDGSRLGLRIGDLTLAILAVHAPAQSLPLHAKTDSDIRGWLGEHL